MKTQIKIYAILLGIVYCLIVISSVGSILSEFKAGFTEGYDRAHIRRESGIMNQKIDDKRSINLPLVATMKRKSERLAFSEKLETEDGKVSYQPIMAFLSLDLTKEDSGGSALLFLSIALVSVIIIGIMMYIPVLFYKILRTTINKEVLDALVIKRISRIGWLLVALFVGKLGIELVNYYMVISNFSLIDYEVVFPGANYNLLIMGVLALFLSQVLKMSMKMKEEQDLTI